MPVRGALRAWDEHYDGMSVLDGPWCAYASRVETPPEQTTGAPAPA